MSSTRTVFECPGCGARFDWTIELKRHFDGSREPEACSRYPNKGLLDIEFRYARRVQDSEDHGEAEVEDGTHDETRDAMDVDDEDDFGESDTEEEEQPSDLYGLFREANAASSSVDYLAAARERLRDENPEYDVPEPGEPVNDSQNAYETVEEGDDNRKTKRKGTSLRVHVLTQRAKEENPQQHRKLVRARQKKKAALRAAEHFKDNGNDGN